ncbi:N-acetylglutamate synthase-like GNAT family acetyltransferase [Sphingomonas vulcanisoli]|uniref:N-acetylglutamate synthase-like GNAT family acetyltransferase n=2 Tax=Sphingomonas vulcanisoli TaxID=1658060 RepID=A0ABX0TVD8_9SPHN|nr:N-acetylglutamate synthase-like GNAT family acetyltransferase [Sphingomonas vulcanisoli]
MSIELREIKLLSNEITPLVIEAESEGHRFVRRLQDDWDEGKNRFQGTGEFLLSVYLDGTLTALGGLNKDPYLNTEGIGRLRHVYVSPSVRHQGIGGLLVNRIIEQAAQTFLILRLRTTTTGAATFYEKLGFERTNEDAATHILHLRAQSRL